MFFTRALRLISCTQFINREILEVVKGEVGKKGEEESLYFLEDGCGAGYTSILAALVSQKCYVWATDINETAVRNTLENAKMHGVEARVNVVIADVFSHNIFAGKEFDVIYWNLPWAGQRTEPGINLVLLMHHHHLSSPCLVAHRAFTELFHSSRLVAAVRTSSHDLQPASCNTISHVPVAYLHGVFRVYQ